MNRFSKVASISIFLLSLLLYSRAARAQQSPVTAIDIALEPDATMVHHAEAVNARLRSVFPKGFSLDATHHPHISILQRYVRTATSTRFTPPPTKFSSATMLPVSS